MIELCGHPMMDALAPHKTNTTYTNTTNAYETNTLKLCGHPIRVKLHCTATKTANISTTQENATNTYYGLVW